MSWLSQPPSALTGVLPSFPLRSPRGISQARVWRPVVLWEVIQEAMVGKEGALVHVRLLATPWTVARQAPLSMDFSRQEYWSGLPFPSPGGLPDHTGSPALQADALRPELPLSSGRLGLSYQQVTSMGTRDTFLRGHLEQSCSTCFRVSPLQVRRLACLSHLSLAEPAFFLRLLFGSFPVPPAL